MYPRVLVIEDDTLTQEWIKTVLEDYGYRVDLTGDGFAAVRLLSKDDYDLALVDFQLPGMDGCAAARIIRSLHGIRAPKLVALTSNLSALEQRAEARELFDVLANKTFDPSVLQSLVAKTIPVPPRLALYDDCLQLWRSLGLPRRPIAKVLPEPSRVERLALTPWIDLTASFEADMILIADRSAVTTLAELRASSDLHLLPVIELDRALGGAADGCLEVHRKESCAEVAALLKRFRAKRDLLSDEALYPADLDTRLLTHLVLSGRSLEPSIDPSRPACVRYNGFFPDDQTIAAAERLAHRGLLTRSFAHRFHQCTSCGSHRLTVCEECPNCRSAQLREVAIIHHFRCAHQGPENEFQSGANLVCPKCRKHLRHYGGDYDKPGSMLICEECGGTNSEPAIGFACLDCKRHVDGDAIGTHDIFCYALTRRGDELLLRSPGWSRDIAGLRRLVPPSVVEAICKLLPDGIDQLAELDVIEVRYAAETAILESEGARALATLRRLFAENMQNLLADFGYVIPHDDVDYLVVHANGAESSAAFAARLMQHSEAGLSRCLEPFCRVVDLQLAQVA